MKTATNIKIYRHAGDVAVTFNYVTLYISQEQAAWLSNQLNGVVVDIECHSFERSRFKPAEYPGYKPASAPLTEQQQRLVNTYLDWVNNFLTVEAFAEHYGLEVAAARTVIETGRNLHNSNLKSLQ